MGLFNQFPFTNFHEMNLDWLINEVKKIKNDISEIDIPISKYTNVLTLGIVNDGKTPVETSKIKSEEYLYFPSGYYLVNNDIDFTNKKVICENDTYFTGVGQIEANNTFIENGNYYMTNGNIKVLDGKNRFVNCNFSAKTTNSNDIAIFKSEHTIIDRCSFDGGNVSRFGIWNDVSEDNCFFTVENSIFKNYYLNAIFSSAENGYISNCYFYSNHGQSNPTGGGQVDFVQKSKVSHHTIIGCYFMSPATNVTSSIETEGGNITVIGCYCNIKGGLYGIAGQNTSEIVAIGNVFDCDINQKAIVSKNNESNFYLIGNIYEGSEYPYELQGKNCVICERNSGNIYPANTESLDFPYVINGTIVNKTFAQNDLVRMFYSGSGFLSITVDGKESRYFYESPGTLNKIYGENISGLSVYIQQYYIEVKNTGTENKKIIIKRE